MERRHRLPVATCKRTIVIPDIADAPIDIGEGCPLFPSVGNTADGRQCAVLHSYVGAACAIGSLRHRLGMGGLQKHRGGDQDRCKRTKRDFHGPQSASLGADEISNSWGGEEPAVDSPAFDHPGVVITASAGDDGYLDWLSGKASSAAEYPASRSAWSSG